MNTLKELARVLFILSIIIVPFTILAFFFDNFIPAIYLAVVCFGLFFVKSESIEATADFVCSTNRCDKLEK